MPVGKLDRTCFLSAFADMVDYPASWRQLREFRVICAQLGSAGLDGSRWGSANADIVDTKTATDTPLGSEVGNVASGNLVQRVVGGGVQW